MDWLMDQSINWAINWLIDWLTESYYIKQIQTNETDKFSSKETKKKSKS